MARYSFAISVDTLFSERRQAIDVDVDGEVLESGRQKTRVPTQGGTACARSQYQRLHQVAE